MRREILLTGFGGQGIILGGILLAEAAVLYEGILATQNQEYGIAARGGECSSEVIMSDSEEINYAEIESPDVVLSMSQEAFNKFASRVKNGGLVIVDTVFVEDISKLDGKECIIKKFPITKISNDATGKTMLANVTALGIISALTGCVSEENMISEITNRVPKGTEEMNVKAFIAGYEAAESGGDAV